MKYRFMRLTTCNDKLDRTKLFPRVGTPPSAAAWRLHVDDIVCLGVHRALAWKFHDLAIRLHEQNLARCPVVASSQSIGSKLVPIAQKRYLRGHQQFNLAHQPMAAAKLAFASDPLRYPYERTRNGYAYSSASIGVFSE